MIDLRESKNRKMGGSRLRGKGAEGKRKYLGGGSSWSKKKSHMWRRGVLLEEDPHGKLWEGE